ncbi:MAG TPA: hypothetical protein VFO25_08270 [Candidatus Eremiobacteraceae bacterium]|nr:hypothetical protein [Candidatus Eremiobacteraceae bacterium]
MSDVGQGVGISLTSTDFASNVSMTKDSRALAVDWSLTRCQGESALSGSGPSLWPSIFGGTDCIGGQYIPVGNVSQSYVNTDLSNCTETHNSQPYDLEWDFLNNAGGVLSNMQPGTGPEVYSVVLHSAVIGGNVDTSRAFKVGDTCDSIMPKKAKYVANPASILYAIDVDEYAQGQTSLSAPALSSVTLTWAAMGCGNSCTEPSDNFNGYGMMQADTESNNLLCPTSTQGGSIELDPTQNAAGTAYYYQPGLEAGRRRILGQLRHRDGTPWLVLANGADCQSTKLPVYDYDRGNDTGNGTDHALWLADVGNVIGMNFENQEAGTCNQWTAGLTGAEPARTTDTVLEGLNSATKFYAAKKMFAWQQLCDETNAGNVTFQSPAGGPQTIPGWGWFDISLRLFHEAVLGITFQPQYTIGRGAWYELNAPVPYGLDVDPTTQIYFLNPIHPMTSYVPGPNPSGDGCTGNGPASTAGNYGSMESGGLLDVAVGFSGTIPASSCGGTGVGATHYFQNGPVLEVQYRACYMASAYEGPCAVVLNTRNGGGITSDYTDTQANIFSRDGGPLVAGGYTHLLTIGDGGTISTDTTLGDVLEGGQLFVNQSSVTIVRSGAGTQATTCTESVSGTNMTVCEAEGVIAFP